MTTETNGNELVRQSAFSLRPQSLSEAIQYAELIAKSNLVPNTLRGKPGDILIAVQMGAEVGLPPMAAIQNIAVINGKPCLWGDAALAVVKAHKECEYVHEQDESEIGKTGSATCKVKRKGSPEVVSTFSIEDAKKAGLLGKQGPWSSYPNRMLKMRARGFAIRDAFPDALKGLNFAEEVQDYVDIEATETKPKPEPKPKVEDKEPIETIDAEVVEDETPEPKASKKTISTVKANAISTWLTQLKITEDDMFDVLKKFGFEVPHDITKDCYEEVREHLKEVAKQKGGE